jgi:hypothetical protein
MIVNLAAVVRIVPSTLLMLGACVSQSAYDHLHAQNQRRQARLGRVDPLAPEAAAHMTHGLGLSRPDHGDLDQCRDLPKPAQSRAQFRPEVDQVTCL